MTRTVAFTKGHGTGNDFVILPDPDGELSLSNDQVAALTDRRFGIGGDGTLRVVRSANLPEGAATADAEWFMDYRNADGSAAEMCGNGMRVFAKYLVESGLASIDEAPLRIGTRGTKVLTRSAGSKSIWDCSRSTSRGPRAGARAGRRPPGLGIDVGNPHVVVAIGATSELDALDLTVQPVLSPSAARRQRGVRRARRPARDRRCGRDPHARLRARCG
jgi:diaminopimelate epimerase